ncbi:MAG TPA: hypothetical protein VFZ69_07710 [Longimicrobiales bacterium]
MDTIDRSQARRVAWLSVSLLACSIGLAACDDSPTDEGDPIEWEADLTSNDLDGTVLVSSTRTRFEATIEIANADATEEYAWRIATGTCAQPGQRIGAATLYPDLDVAANGTAEAEATVAAALDEDDDYIAQVIDDSGTSPAVVACGELAVQD